MQKMSKSKGNAISPDEYVDNFGSDILRLYLCFGFNYVEGGPWSEGGFKSASRFAERCARLMEEKVELLSSSLPEQSYSSADKKLLYVLHNSIKGVNQDTQRFMFNTSIARLMELYNAITDYENNSTAETINNFLMQQTLKTFLVLLSPFMPHFCEEWWQLSGEQQSIFNQKFPEHDNQFLQLDEIKMAVMINGKRRDEVTVSASSTEDQVLNVALDSTKVQKHLEGMQIIKQIFVKGKLINLIVKPS